MTDELFREDATLALCDARVVAVGEGGVILARGSILARVARASCASGGRERARGSGLYQVLPLAPTDSTAMAAEKISMP